MYPICIVHASLLYYVCILYVIVYVSYIVHLCTLLCIPYMYVYTVYVCILLYAVLYMYVYYIAHILCLCLVYLQYIHKYTICMYVMYYMCSQLLWNLYCVLCSKKRSKHRLDCGPRIGVSITRLPTSCYLRKRKQCSCSQQPFFTNAKLVTQQSALCHRHGHFWTARL